MFEYTFTKPSLKIDIPVSFDYDNAEKQIIQKPEYTHIIVNYPNGFIFESIKYSDRMVIKTNKPLIEIEQDKFTVQL